MGARPENPSTGTHTHPFEISFNVPSMLQDSLVDYCNKKSESHWLKDNMAGIEAYNERIERGGVFASKYRRF